MAKNGSGKKSGTITFREAGKAYVAHLQATGKAEPSIRSYTGDVAAAIIHFGPDRDVAKILAPHMAKYLGSAIFTTKRDGAPKAELSLKKSRRALRQFFEWAKSQGHAQHVPFAAK